MYRFDDEKREISFDDFRTPTPWVNYLSNGTFHAMISQAGGGAAFYGARRCAEEMPRRECRRYGDKSAEL